MNTTDKITSLIKKLRIKKTMNPIIFFTTYCDTQEKLDILKENIKYVKYNYPDYQIGIHAHYPIGTKIQNLVDHYIFDRANTYSSTMRILVWKKLYNVFQLTNDYPDYGYAAFHQSKMIASYVQSLNEIKDVIVLNYDVNTRKSSFTDLMSFFKDKSNVFFEFEPINHNLQGISFVGFKFDKNLMYELTKDLTLQMNESETQGTNLVIEHWFRNKLTEKHPELKIYSHDLVMEFLDTLVSTTQIEELTLIEDESILEYFNKITLVGNSSDNPIYNNCIFMWGVKPKEFIMKLEIDGVVNEHLITINNDYFKLFKLNNKTPKNVKIIQINNTEVDHLIFDSKLKNSKKALTLTPQLN